MPTLWRFSLKSNDNIITDCTTTNQTTPEAHRAYDLTILESLVRYMHAAVGFPVKSTWLKAIKKGNLEIFPGLTYSNAAKYFPHAVETIKRHMVQSSQEVRSTKKKKHQSRGNKKAPDQVTLEKQYEEKDIPPPLKTKKLHIWDQPISKLYTDDCGRFPI